MDTGLRHQRLTARAEARRQRAARRSGVLEHLVNNRPLLALPKPPAVTYITPKPKKIKTPKVKTERMHFPWLHDWIYRVRVGFTNPPDAQRIARQNQRWL